MLGDETGMILSIPMPVFEETFRMVISRVSGVFPLIMRRIPLKSCVLSFSPSLILYSRLTVSPTFKVDLLKMNEFAIGSKL